MSNIGQFEGEVRVEWVVHAGADRRMRLLEDFAFVDSQGFRWVAAEGDEIDGASIPKIFWTTEGSPFVGDYRRASVLHDVACQKKTEPSKAVHQMFYEAMLTAGVGELRAGKMYTAVRLFGPDWKVGAGPAGLAEPAVAEPVSFELLEQAVDAALGAG